MIISAINLKVKMLESQVERMKHHMLLSQSLANRQHLEIARSVAVSFLVSRLVIFSLDSSNRLF
jgi:hypothetical protein